MCPGQKFELEEVAEEWSMCRMRRRALVDQLMGLCVRFLRGQIFREEVLVFLRSSEKLLSQQLVVVMSRAHSQIAIHPVLLLYLLFLLDRLGFLVWSADSSFCHLDLVENLA